MSILETEDIFQMESLNALFEHATEGIIICDQKGTIIRVNPSAEKVFGYQHLELLGKKIEELVPNKFSNDHSKLRDGYMKHPHARSMGKNMDLYAKRKDHTEFPVEISLSYYKQKDEMFVIAFIFKTLNSCCLRSVISIMKAITNISSFCL